MLSNVNYGFIPDLDTRYTTRDTRYKIQETRYEIQKVYKLSFAYELNLIFNIIVFIIFPEILCFCYFNSSLFVLTVLTDPMSQ